MSKASKGRGPNILLITTDQQRWDHIGLAGVKGIETPNIDRIGQEGMHFPRAYCPSPMCTPSRVSLLTGQYPSSHGAYSIGVTAEPFPGPTLPEILGQHGYHTSVIGKTHFVRRADEESHMSGVEENPPEFWQDWHGPYLGFEEVHASIGHTTNADPNQHYRSFLEEQDVDWERWFPYSRGESPYPYEPGRWDISAECHDTEWVTGLTEAYIEKRTEDAARPWFCWASYQDPHEPIVCPEPWFSSVDTSELEVFPDKRNREFDDKPAIYQELYERGPNEMACNTDGLGLPSAFANRMSDAERLTELQATLGMVAFIDHGVGRLLRKLDATSQLENTIIIFTSDHGEYHGHHGFWGKGFPAYDDAQRVPFVICGPGVSSSDVADRLINLVDLPKTLLAMLGVAPPVGMQGRDMSQLLARGEADIPNETLVECHANEEGLYQQTYLSGPYKLVIYREFPEGEIYDLRLDPDQHINLWNQPEYQQVKSDLLLAFVRFNLIKEGRVNPRTAYA